MDVMYLIDALAVLAPAFTCPFPTTTASPRRRRRNILLVLHMDDGDEALHQLEGTFFT